MALTDAQLEQAVQQFTSAVGKGNTAAAQELIRQWNLTYTNSVAEQYGQNFGVGQPAPPGAGTLAQGTATGGIGYIPGFSGLDASQSMANLSGQASTQQGAAGLTGFYTAPSQSQYTPGTFVRLDPNTYDTSTYGAVQLSYVLPSGQLQRVNIPQAQAMGWNGSLTTIPTIAAQQAMALEQAPPSQLPQQTLAGMTGYSNLNTAAMNNAVAQSGVTGTYQAPSQIYAPGTNAGGGKFSDLDPQTQRGYFVSNGGDWNAAMTAWVRDSNQAIAAASPGGVLPNQQGTPQRTLQAQNQYATQYGYVPQAYDASGVPIGANGQPLTTLAGQNQTYTQQMGMIKQAADLQANPFRQQQAIGQMGNLLSGGGVAGFSAPNTVTGVGTVGGNTQGGMGYLSQLISDIREPSANTASMNSVLDAIPTPTKLNSVEFQRAAPSTQSMVLQGMQEKYGLDPKDSLAQIQNTLPQFTAPQTLSGTIKR